ncbi:MAG: hypothetical protein Q9N68_13045 [Gammaproteobacteria bacterium]|nr:hypothetical protein [Gammaproteobacteria bacterium]
MIKASAFIRTDTLILLASAISITAFVYFSSNDNADPIAVTTNISPIGKLVVTHNPADASDVLQQLASLNAINTASSEQKNVEPAIKNSSHSALTSAVANASSTTTEKSAVVATTQAATPVHVVKNRAPQPYPTHYRRYYNMPFPMPVYQMPPPTNPYRYQYGHTPYPTSR